MELKNYHKVSYNDERLESDNLIDKIVETDWLKPDTILVNCFPEYSSRLTYLLAHKLSYLNNNELYEVVDLKMPYKTMIQVWDPDDMIFKMYGNYLSDWIRKNLHPSNRYLFVASDVFNPFQKLKSMLKGKIDNENIRFATLFKPRDATFLPDIFAHEYAGTLLFQWENIDNPNK